MLLRQLTRLTKNITCFSAQVWQIGYRMLLLSTTSRSGGLHHHLRARQAAAVENFSWGFSENYYWKKWQYQIWTKITWFSASFWCLLMSFVVQETSKYLQTLQTAPRSQITSLITSGSAPAWQSSMMTIWTSEQLKLRSVIWLWIMGRPESPTYLVEEHHVVSINGCLKISSPGCYMVLLMGTFMFSAQSLFPLKPRLTLNFQTCTARSVCCFKFPSPAEI